jgi:chondroitin 4-sulfotransferase 11
MINHEKKCIFIHIPKTGGTSIWNGIIERSHNPNLHVQHFDLKHEVSDTTRDYFKTSFVRNPWDRLVSIYFYYKNGGNKGATDRRIQRSVPETFEKFCYSDIIIGDSGKSSTIDATKSMSTFFNSDINMDFIGKFENIEEDFEIIKRKLNITSHLIHIRKGNHKPYQHYYNQSTEQHIGEIFKTDITKFNYNFNG